jgi:hypothetical protein
MIYLIVAALLLSGCTSSPLGPSDADIKKAESLMWSEDVTGETLTVSLRIAAMKPGYDTSASRKAHDKCVMDLRNFCGNNLAACETAKKLASFNSR